MTPPEAIQWGIAVLLGVITLVGLATRFILLPWLRDNLTRPVAQVQKQVSENTHSNDPPTVLDRIDDVKTQIEHLSRVLDGHLSWSERWTALIEREVTLLRRERAVTHKEGNEDNEHHG